ncbi:hypothetical protein SAMD00019534_101560 [Acytostelium subglobosum LB1]|uniref:hypothetical protein n=1 Tax=Acytostelium subglobosum LB1 TaxID=1410327 RepID=UPI0006449F59|nr:hypothetical protein SAMD00019534_101560 [Acytostelium subglobosum LB1]GAM26981.1 hypothetical protein SAMD00019534_101560 [Acytostelium subglobosum LB1]|eukprot:XP_012750249.1 hypothetical protein SAMD00019534_101560 [Acytostelium subglobosum LB1]
MDASLFPPTSVQTLAIEANKEVQGSLPDSITKLTIMLGVKGTVAVGVIPESVRSLTLTTQQPLAPGTIPKSVRSLTLYTLQPLAPGTIPQSVTKLSAPRFMNFTLGCIPTSITTLILTGCDQTEWLVGLTSLTALTLMDNNSATLPKLPTSVTLLHLGRYNFPLRAGVLPDTLTSLRLDTYDHDLQPRSLPSQLIRLELKTFNKLIDVANHLPPTLKYLKMDSFNMSLDLSSLPLVGLDLRAASWECKIPPTLTSLIYTNFHPNYNNYPPGLTKLGCNGSFLCRGYMFPPSITKLFITPTMLFGDHPCLSFCHGIKKLTTTHLGSILYNGCQAVNSNKYPITLRQVTVLCEVGCSEISLSQFIKYLMIPKHLSSLVAMEGKGEGEDKGKG